MDAQNFLSTEIGSTRQDEGADCTCGPQTRYHETFEQLLAKWLPYVPRRFRPFIEAWNAAHIEAEAKELSEASLRALRGMMRRDVEQHVEILWNASPTAITAWVAWHPKWVKAFISERAATDPLFALSERERAKALRARATAADTERKRQTRNRTIAKRLYDHIEAAGGWVAWDTIALAKAVSSKRGGRRIDPQKIFEIADALVRADVAGWCTRSGGQPWALKLVRQRSSTVPSTQYFR